MSTKVTASLVKELRDRTGVGMSKCKKALEESSGDLEQAVIVLRKAGMATAESRGARETKEGLIAIGKVNGQVALVEVSAETDFVVNNNAFQDFLSSIAEEVAKTKPESLESFISQPFSKDSTLTIEQYRTSMVQKVGENIQIKRFVLLPNEANKTIGAYLHMKGKIATVVELNGDGNAEELANAIAMHVAAAAPDYVKSEDIPEDILAREKDIAKSQVQGKPEYVIDKIIEGKLQAFYKGVCLLNQPYVRDDKLTITDLLSQKGKESGKTLSIDKFLRWSVG